MHYLIKTAHNAGTLITDFWRNYLLIRKSYPNAMKYHRNFWIGKNTRAFKAFD